MYVHTHITKKHNLGAVGYNCSYIIKLHMYRYKKAPSSGDHEKIMPLYANMKHSYIKIRFWQKVAKLIITIIPTKLHNDLHPLGVSPC